MIINLLIMFSSIHVFRENVSLKNRSFSFARNTPKKKTKILSVFVFNVLIWVENVSMKRGNNPTKSILSY